MVTSKNSMRSRMSAISLMALVLLTACASQQTISQTPECYHPQRTENATLRDDLEWTIRLDTALEACNYIIKADNR